MAGSKSVERWGAHVRRAQRQGKSLWRYAQENGIGYEKLRRVRAGLEATGAESGAQDARDARVVTGDGDGNAFTRVQVRQEHGAVRSAPDRVQVQFPSGVVVEFDSDGPVTARIGSIIATLGSFSCCASTRG
jgi:hypothetical protein